MLNRNFSYTWNSKATNAPLTLSASVRTKDNGLTPSLNLSIEHNGITWTASPCGIGPIVDEIPDWSTISFSAVANGRLSWLKVNAPRDVVLSLRHELEAAQADHLTHMMTTAGIRYELHPENPNDINSGFFDQLIESLIRARFEILAVDQATPEALHSVMFEALDQNLLYKLTKQLDDLFAEQAHSNYTPFPVDPTWSKKTRDYLDTLLAEGKAPGAAMIPASDVVAAIDALLAEHLPAQLRNAQDRYDAIVAKEASYPRHYTAKEAAAWARSYNSLQNEGGEGYVPHIITQQEAAHAAENSAICAALLRRLA